MIGEKPREIAFRVLSHRQRAEEYVEKLLEQELAQNPLGGANRALCKELVYGVARWQRTLDWLVARKTEDRDQNAGVRALLHLGLYQLLWLDRIPDHAAVHETVELGKRFGFGTRAGFLNAVLRGYVREREATVATLQALKETDPALGYSHPAWLFQRWDERWGRAKTIALLDWNNRPAPVYGRVNRLKTDAAALAIRWRDEGIEFEKRSFAWAGENDVFELKSYPPLAQCRSFQEGLFYVQDPSTLLAAELLEAQRGDIILDMCAAPGGKTTCIAQTLSNEGRVIARDSQPARLKALEENCRRLGAVCVEIGDDSTITFDRILLDAPCSNTGVLRRRVEARWRLQPAEVERLQQGQAALLTQAARQLKPGGILVYSTCSLEPEENENVVENFLAAHSGFELSEQRQLLPFIEGVDGAYAARLRRIG